MAASSPVPNSLRPSAIISARILAFSSRPTWWISCAGSDSDVCTRISFS